MMEFVFARIAVGVTICETSIMFERFTDNAIKVVIRAQEESRRLGHNYVGTELLLLGLVGVSTGLASRALQMHGVNIAGARSEVEKVIGWGDGAVQVETSFTPRAKNVLRASCSEADKHNELLVHTEHLLLGLLADESNVQGVAMSVLESLGVTPSAVIQTLDELLQERLKTEKPKARLEPHRMEPSSDGQSLYEILQVDPCAEFRVILEAYTYLVKKYHPESESGDIAQFRRINFAWMILLDQISREEYDLSLQIQAQQSDV